jgi:hypothetical protein
LGETATQALAESDTQVRFGALAVTDDVKKPRYFEPESVTSAWIQVEYTRCLF